MPSLKLKPITPPKLPTGREYAQAIEKAIYKTANLVQSDLQSTTRTWKHKPAFFITVSTQGADYVIAAGTNDKIYGYVDAGTKPHVIKPKRSKYLRFSSGYRAKTRVGIIGSQEGGSFGGDVYRQSVRHPGFPGRKFIVSIQKRRQKTLEQETSQAVAKVARRQQ